MRAFPARMGAFGTILFPEEELRRLREVRAERYGDCPPLVVGEAVEATMKELFGRYRDPPVNSVVVARRALIAEMLAVRPMSYQELAAEFGVPITMIGHDMKAVNNIRKLKKMEN